MSDDYGYGKHVGQTQATDSYITVDLPLKLKSLLPSEAGTKHKPMLLRWPPNNCQQDPPEHVLPFPPEASCSRNVYPQ